MTIDAIRNATPAYTKAMVALPPNTRDSCGNRSHQERIDQCNQRCHARGGEHRHGPKRRVSASGFDDTRLIVMNREGEVWLYIGVELREEVADAIGDWMYRTV